MNKSRKSSKIISQLLIVFMLGGILGGCSSSTEQNSNSKADQKTSSKSENENVTLTWWLPLADRLIQNYKSASDVPFYQELQKQTGVTLKFIHPSPSQVNEQFNIMVASREFPDMIQYKWLSIPGGPEKAIKDKVIQPLNEIIDKNSPNLKKYLENNKNIDKQVKTDSGTYYCYPYIYGDPTLTVVGGPIMRKDWLDELNLSTPETVDEWYMVLKAFKEMKGCTAPVTFTMDHLKRYNAFIGTYGITMGFYQNNGKIKFGPIEPEYKEFLTTFRKWYKEGLIDPEFTANDTKTLDAKITGDKSGAFIGVTFGGFGKYLTLMKDQNPKFNLTAARYPSLKKGEKTIIAQKWNEVSDTRNAITATSKNIVAAAKFLDYGYGEKGHMLYNFGPEGVSYNMINDYPKYTDIVLKDSKLAPIDMLSRYAPSANDGSPFVLDIRSNEQMFTFDQQKNAKSKWTYADNSRLLPPVSMLAEESDKMASIMTEVNTYVEEMFLKFIMGQESIDNFDAYVNRIKSMKIDQAIKMEQDALDRYNKR